ncbi:disease resistance protein RUN1-like [Rosa chinensis]|uniref:disease resistance protein RUN1-like n=1 Tax=Rosa chinensis TaxID=74649 RepID=UPI001AD9143E|nr:disease resistance protein RUN1-like [Rosa chinensis]
MDVLQISFDGLEEKDKQIFLHIACLYKEKDRDRVTQILGYCKLDSGIGLRVLEEKSLITIFNNKLLMHDLLQEMGLEIVRRESPEEPGKRSRLWSPEDIHNVLKKNKGTDKIRSGLQSLRERNFTGLRSPESCDRPRDSGRWRPKSGDRLLES